MAQLIPKNLYDLIEHVELNKSGWWDDALSNVLLGAIWLHGEPVPRGGVRDLVVSAFNLEIPADRIAQGIQRLANERKLAVDRHDNVVADSKVVKQMEAQSEAAKRNEDDVRSAFVERISDRCAPHSPETTWTLFNQQYLLPMIDVLGARTVQLMGRAEAVDSDVTALTREFFALFDSSCRVALRSAIGSFLDPNDAKVRRYVTAYLDASFLVRASGLTNAALVEISEFGRKPPAFRLFLDTNFLFSLLDLHDNPSNESAQMLGEMIRQVGKHLSIKMYVILPTMEEIKRTLLAVRRDLTGMKIVPALTDAALEVGISGIAMRFFRANQDAAQPISPEDYFEPFLKDLTIVLRANGIEVYNEQTTGYRGRQDVVDDIHQLSGGEGAFEAERQRSYNAALHDSILWHFTHDKRPAMFESPLQAVFWAVTNDYRLINFDRRRRRAQRAVVGVCIHPAELLQVLRLWEPRSTDMEQALMSGLRLPFMFYEFNSGREAASLRILRAMSRFEHIESLGAEAIRDMVLNDAVRSKIGAATTEEEEVAAIHDAALAEYNHVVKQRDAAISKAKEAAEALGSEREGALRRSAADKGKQAQTDGRIAELETELNSERQESRASGDQLKALEAKLEAKDVQHQAHSARNRFVLIRGVGGAALLAALYAGLGYGWAAIGATSPLVVSLGIFVMWAVSWLFVLTTRVRDPDVREWPLIRTILDARRWIVGVFVALLVAIAANGIWQEVIRPYWAIQ